MSYALEWQIFSNVQKRVIATIRTEGVYDIDKAVDDGFSEMHNGALKIAVRKFPSEPAFRDAYISDASSTTPNIGTTTRPSTISYSNNNKGPNAISDGVGGVVAIFNGSGFGSGFLIGAEGLLLTNQHVVDKDKFVKVRWADGFETVGEVLHTDAKRDVALVKTDGRGRAPLKLATVQPRSARRCTLSARRLTPNFRAP